MAPCPTVCLICSSIQSPLFTLGIWTSMKMSQEYWALRQAAMRVCGGEVSPESMSSTAGLEVDALLAEIGE